VSSGWDEDEEDNDFPIGGNISSTGYAYDDTFTVEEIEEILSPFMGTHLTFDDYKKLDELTGDNNTRNIIYPILDVLNKAADKLKTDKIVIDAVIMNGGMSKFYMITDRLKQFFGFDPIVALDPDQAVARGAAVYHYYLHRFDEIKDDMRMVGDTDSAKSAADKKFESDDGATLLKAPLSIEWGRNILNDSLYLATKNDTQVKIIPSGAELPYTSEMMKGFKLMPNYKQITIPILSRNIDSTYRVIARGNIVFTRKYPDGAYVAFRVYMASSKVITMEAWTCNDVDGTQVLEQGRVDISIHNDFSTDKKNKIIPRVGTNLKPEAVLNNIEQLCRNYENLYGKSFVAKKSAIAKEIRTLVNSVCTAGNVADFAAPILRMISGTRSNEFKQRCFIIARKIGSAWTEDQKRRLATECMLQLDSDLQGINLRDYWSSSASTNTKMQAIFAMSMCASTEQLNQLERLHSDDRYLNACLYTHAKTKTQIDWIYDCFKRDVVILKRGMKSNIQFSSYSIGLAFYLDGRQTKTRVDKNVVVSELCDAILNLRLSVDELICCVLALGWICDRRTENDIKDDSIDEALRTLEEMNVYFSSDEKRRLFKMQSVVKKLIQGQVLSKDEEEFLLLKLNGFDN
ncbi:MAG: Hsp70 family protein, partial [Selenomonadaceae bacterium]|nr:Hsp70 family protein [Selenomonadaceae bacterium]